MAEAEAEAVLAGETRHVPVGPAGELARHPPPRPSSRTLEPASPRSVVSEGLDPCQNTSRHGSFGAYNIWNVRLWAWNYKIHYCDDGFRVTSIRNERWGTVTLTGTLIGWNAPSESSFSGFWPWSGVYQGRSEAIAHGLAPVGQRYVAVIACPYVVNTIWGGGKDGSSGNTCGWW